MKLIAYIHLTCPEHNAGSETTVHAVFRALVERGHKVDVICDRSKKAPYVFEGVNVIRPPRRGADTWLRETVRDADLLITHLDLTRAAMDLAINVKIPLVHFVHNDAQLMCWRVDARVPYKNALTVYNSNWLAAKPSTFNGQEMPEEWSSPYSVVVHPIIDPGRYRCERGPSVTLVNPTPTKGAATFYELARRLPDVPFLTAAGGYGTQVSCQAAIRQFEGMGLPKYEGPRVSHSFFEFYGENWVDVHETLCNGFPNVTHVNNDPDVRNIFQRTKVLLMPSDAESYGRVGVEAACAGIPTIAHPTTGLQEALGDAGIFIDRNDYDGWEAEVRRLLTDDVYYRQRSNAVLALADSLDPESEFDRIEQAFIETAQRYQTGETKSMRMWKSDAWIWKLQDGNYKKTSDRRIPVDAVTLFAGIGTMVPEDLAKQNGWIGPDGSIDEKAIAGPAENKAIESPEENKTRGRKKKEDVAA